MGQDIEGRFVNELRSLSIQVPGMQLYTTVQYSTDALSHHILYSYKTSIPLLHPHTHHPHESIKSPKSLNLLRHQNKRMDVRDQRVQHRGISKHI
jgi:hypothetical protein